MTQLVTAENILGAYRAYCSSMKYTSQRNTISVVFSTETFYRCFSATLIMLKNRLTDNAKRQMRLAQNALITEKLRSHVFQTKLLT